MSLTLERAASRRAWTARPSRWASVCPFFTVSPSSTSTATTRSASLVPTDTMLASTRQSSVLMERLSRICQTPQMMPPAAARAMLPRETAFRCLLMQ